MAPQNLQAETDADFESTNPESTKEELAKLVSSLKQALSQQERIQLSVILTQTDENKIKIDLNSQQKGDVKKFLTSDELCDMLKIPKHFLHKYARKGIIPGFKVGREWRFEAERIFKLFREL
jgi:excisionase family DNA binding protein